MRHRLVARSLQSPPAAQQPRISTTGSGNDQDASLAARLRCAPPPAQAGIGGDLQLTMQPDQSSRAVHHSSAHDHRGSGTEDFLTPGGV